MYLAGSHNLVQYHLAHYTIYEVQHLPCAGGEERIFNFEKYIMLQAAHDELRYANETVLEACKVNLLLNSIRNTNLAAVLNEIRATLVLLHNFTRAANFLENNVNLTNFTLNPT